MLLLFDVFWCICRREEDEGAGLDREYWERVNQVRSRKSYLKWRKLKEVLQKGENVRGAAQKFERSVSNEEEMKQQPVRWNRFLTELGNYWFINPLWKSRNLTRSEEKITYWKFQSAIYIIIFILSSCCQSKLQFISFLHSSICNSAPIQLSSLHRFNSSFAQSPNPRPIKCFSVLPFKIKST